MTRILVRPSDLQSLSLRLTQAVGELQATASRLRRAANSLDWDVRAEMAVGGQVDGALRLAANLARQGEATARYLSEQARAFTETDLALARELEKAMASLAGALGTAVTGGALGLGALGHAIGQWTGVGRLGGAPGALSGAVAAAALGGATMVTGGTGNLAERFPKAYGPVLVPPGPDETRLPTDAEVRYIQQVYGIHEDGYGQETKEAVRQLQLRHGIGVDAALMIGPLTWAALKTEAAQRQAHPEGGVLPSGGGQGCKFADTYLRSAADLEARLNAINQPGVARWASLIWQVAKEKDLRPEYIAAAMIQESHGDSNAGAGGTTGQGLMQVEFYAHKSSIPGSTDEERLAWIRVPENNVRVGADLLKAKVERYVRLYGPDEGLKRGLQYYNYGSGASDWVEAHTTSPADWQQAVDKYHNTHRWTGERWVEVESGGDYGTTQYWKETYRHYQGLKGAAGLAATPVEAAPVASHPATDLQSADGTMNEKAWEPVSAPVTNSTDTRSATAYSQVIDQFTVSSNPRYRVRDLNGDGESDTFCNIYVWDVTRAMGAEVPHWANGQGVPVTVGDGHELNANGVARWLSGHGEAYGWTEVSPEQAQALANEGKPVVAAWDSGSASPGHVAMVRPGTYGTADGPVIAQAGAHNLDRTTASGAFGQRVKEAKYYAHG
jgi:hypothetical protein